MRKIADTTAQEKLRQEEHKIAFNNNVRSLVENYRQVLNDGKKVSLADAYALYSRKPSRKRKCCDKTRKQKERSSIGRKSTGFQKSSDGS